MQNWILFIFFSSLVLFAILIGSKRMSLQEAPPVQHTIPSIGSIELCNGCGIAGAANAVADFLRKKDFDVKNIQNAERWNFPATVVVSRTLNMNVARKVADALHTGKVILLRSGDDLYDVTVFIGPDFGVLIQ